MKVHSFLDVVEVSFKLRTELSHDCNDNDIITHRMLFLWCFNSTLQNFLQKKDKITDLK